MTCHVLATVSPSVCLSVRNMLVAWYCVKMTHATIMPSSLNDIFMTQISFLVPGLW